MIYVVSSYSPIIQILSYEVGFKRKSDATKELRRVVKEEKSACKMRYQRASVLWSEDREEAKVMIGGKQGVHLWARLLLVRNPSVPVLKIV